MTLSRKAIPSGHWVKTLEGYKAFRPHPLPPAIDWNERLVRSLSRLINSWAALPVKDSGYPTPTF